MPTDQQAILASLMRYAAAAVALLGVKAMPTFKGIREALEYTVSHLIPKRHSYIIELRGPDRFNAGQIVDQDKVFGDGEAGLTLYLPFDPSGEQQRAEEARFLALPIKDHVVLVPWQGIPCYAARFGTDIETAIKVTWAVASTVFYNADSVYLNCTVYDEGPING